MGPEKIENKTVSRRDFIQFVLTATAAGGILAYLGLRNKTQFSEILPEAKTVITNLGEKIALLVEQKQKNPDQGPIVCGVNIIKEQSSWFQYMNKSEAPQPNTVRVYGNRNDLPILLECTLAKKPFNHTAYEYYNPAAADCPDIKPNEINVWVYRVIVREPLPAGSWFESGPVQYQSHP